MIRITKNKELYLNMKIDHKESFSDFGKQFSIDSEIDGYWGSKEMLNDIVFPFNLNLIKSKKVMEVGSGSGRILKKPSLLPAIRNH